MDPKVIAQLLFGARIAVGIAFLAAPAFVGERWIGNDGRSTTVRAITRAVGVRDLAIGLGGMRSLYTDQRTQPWVDAGIASDAVDAGATWLAIRQIGLVHALPTLAFTKVGILMGLTIRKTVD